MSHDTFDRRSAGLAEHLIAGGLAEGDRVALILENCPEFFVAIWAARRAGLRFVPINWHLHIDEATHVVGDCDARAIITTSALSALARTIAARCPLIEIMVTSGPTEPGLASIDEIAVAWGDRSRQDATRQGGPMLYSSGTTGLPKGILRPLLDAPFATPTGLEGMYAELYGLGPDTVYLSPAPAYHGAPVSWTQAVLIHGGTVVVLENFDAEATLAAIERYSVTHAQFVPTHFVRMLRLPDETRARYDTASLRVVIHGAAPCAPDVKQQMIDWLGPIIHEFYSGSERCGITFCNAQEWLVRPGTVGKSKSGRIHIINPESGEEQPEGEIGLVYFEDPDRFAYHRDSLTTAQCFNARGWGTHGDLGWVDAEGYLYLSDRRSDLILSGGVNIYPQEIENLLAQHPGVEDVAVIGLPDAEFGEAVHAVVQPADGFAADTALAEDLLRFCRERLSGFKRPRSIGFTNTLPRQPNGKLLRRLVRKDVGQTINAAIEGTA